MDLYSLEYLLTELEAYALHFLDNHRSHEHNIPWWIFILVWLNFQNIHYIKYDSLCIF